ncbi:Cof-type HAD-IIB family hydrolase [Clostridium oceanicum]|uniref:Cof-type HAD-IIB family hydrolase n=1 Tax=Clostridium oceanicum TaxID=1543 RepID=A0ABP3V5C3_9CLOT
MYKLIAIDMDGTLLNDDKIITDKNLRMIENAKNKGVKVVICSGRIPGGLKFYEKTISKGQPMICANGAIILNDKKDIIFSDSLKKDTFGKIVDTLRKDKDTYYHFYDDNIMCTEKMEFSANKIYEFNNKIDRQYRMEIRVVPDSKEYIKRKVGLISKLVVVDEDREYLKKLRKNIQDKFEVSITKSNINNIEITSKGINKGIGLKKLANYYNIPIDQCIAIGNDENDISMIKEAGIGVVMKNARDSIKTFGNYITKNDNNNDGIAEVIEKFVL